MKNSKPGEKYAEIRYQQLVRTIGAGYVLTEKERAEFLALSEARKAPR